MTDFSSIQSAIISSNLNSNELLELNRILITELKATRTVEAVKAKRHLRVGLTVTFAGKRNVQMRGKITAVKQKFCTVDCGGYRNQWRVNMANVTVVG